MHPPVQATQLKRFAALTATLFVVCLGLFVWQTWLLVRQEKLRDMKTVLELAAKSSDHYFLQMQVSLADLGAEIKAGPGLTSLAAAQVMLQKFQNRHTDLELVVLMDPEGQFLAVSTTPDLTGLPSIARTRDFSSIVAALAPEFPLELATPMYAPMSQRWVFPMRYAVRNNGGKLIAFLVATVPVEMLQSYWAEAPTVSKVSIILQRDDGYLLSRYPLPPGTNYEALYGMQRTGTLRNYLLEHNFPASGDVEGFNTTGRENYANVFRRLEHFPVTMAVAMPLSEFQLFWWDQYKLPFLLPLLMAIGIASGFFFYLRQQKIWITRYTAANARLDASIKALTASEERAQIELNDQADVISRIAANGNVLYANDAFCKVFGIAREDYVGGPWQQVAFPQDIALAERRMANLSAQNSRVEGDNRVITANGEVRWFHWINTGVFGHDDKLLEIQSVGRDVTLRREAEDSLRLVSDELTDLYDHAPVSYFSLDGNGTIVQINRKGLEWLGRTRQQVVGRMHGAAMFTLAMQDLFNKSFLALLATGSVGDLELDLVNADGDLRRVMLSATALRDPDDGFIKSRSVMYDITELRQMEAEKNRLLHEMAAMLDNDLVGIIKIKNRVIVWQNKAVQTLFGYAPQDLIGKSTRILYPDDESYDRMGDSIRMSQSTSKQFRGQAQILHKNGELIWIDCYGDLLSAIEDESMWVLVDITAMKSQKLRLQQMASHDSLTGLANRTLLMDRLHQAMAASDRTGRQLALCFLDLDGFKPVNDQLGHAAGDQVLQEVAKRLTTCLRANDTVARVGGDEFVLLLTALEQVDEIDFVLQRVIETISLPFQIEASEAAKISVSIGVSVYPDDTRNATEMLSFADQAMYQAKQQGRNRCCRRGIDPK